MANRISSLSVGKIAERSFSIIGVLSLLVLAGCSSYTEPSAADQKALAKTELHFDLNKCEDLGAGLYKCPASDKPICSPDYNGQVECVRIGPKGSVFVQSGAP